VLPELRKGKAAAQKAAGAQNAQLICPKRQGQNALRRR
jgi:hypothetical protein